MVREREILVLKSMPRPILREICITSIKDFATFSLHKKNAITNAFQKDILLESFGTIEPLKAFRDNHIRHSSSVKLFSKSQSSISCRICGPSKTPSLILASVTLGNLFLKKKRPASPFLFNVLMKFVIMPSFICNPDRKIFWGSTSHFWAMIIIPGSNVSRAGQTLTVWCWYRALLSEVNRKIQRIGYFGRCFSCKLQTYFLQILVSFLIPFTRITSAVWLILIILLMNWNYNTSIHK